MAIFCNGIMALYKFHIIIIIIIIIIILGGFVVIIIVILPLSAWQLAEWLFPGVAKRHLELESVQNAQTFWRNQLCLGSGQQSRKDGPKILRPHSKPGVNKYAIYYNSKLYFTFFCML